MKDICMGMCNSISKKCCTKSAGLLVIRLAVGGLFLFHGVMKLSAMGQTVGFFHMIGFGAFFAYLVAIVETVGGVLMILGTATCVVGFLLAFIMVVAIIVVKSKMPFGAGEIDIALLASSLGIALAGPGKYAFGPCCKKCVGDKMGSCRCDTDMKCDGCDEMCKDGVCGGHEGK